MISNTDIEDMTYAQDEALLPCPFCGEIPELEFLEVLVNFRCPPVSSCNGTGLIICCTKDNLKRAITAWNRRAALVAAPQPAPEEGLGGAQDGAMLGVIAARRAQA